MKTVNKLFHCLRLSIVILCCTFTTFAANATVENKFPLDIYNVALDSLNSFRVVKKGTSLDLILLNAVTTKGSENNEPINFSVPNNENLDLKASGVLSMSSSGKRFAQSSTLKFSANKFYLADGQEVFFSANSPLFYGVHPPHTSNNTLGLAKTITNLSITSSPLTFGASLGISFLVNGFLSAHQNGLSDFVWGGLNGTGLSFIERIFRKQPDLYLTQGVSIPFVLTEDLKINDGIQKEKIEYLNISKEEAMNKIQKLLEWGDLTGALELSIKTDQKEIYNELMKKIIF